MYEKSWDEELLREMAEYPSEKVDEVENPLLVQFLIKRKPSENLEDYNKKCIGIIEYLKDSSSNTILESLTGSEKTKVEALRELIKRLTSYSGAKVSIRKSDDIFKLVRHYAYFAEQESLYAIYLNPAHEAIRVVEASRGLLNRALVHPREIFKEAIRLNACKVAIAHNHTSGNVEPSEEDDMVTQRIAEAGKLLGIGLIDHIIFSADSYYSYMAKGRL